MTLLLTLLLLPFASAFLAALLGLRDGGHIAWGWVRMLLLATLFLSLMLWLGDAAVTATIIALVVVTVLHVAGFYLWRIFGTGLQNHD
jgi:hypothetical protein